MESNERNQSAGGDGVQAARRCPVHAGGAFSRRSFLQRMAAVSLGAISARGVYELLDTFQGGGPQRVLAATSTRQREQYLIQSLEVIQDNGVTLVIPPLHTDVFTAKLSASVSWTKAALKSAQSRLEKALETVEQPYPATAAGLTIVVGWGLPYFRTYVPAPWKQYAPIDNAYSKQTGITQYAVLDAVAFPSDPSNVILEQNQVVFKFRSDSQSILQSTEHALFDDPTNSAYIGDLFDLTSKRTGFLGRGFNTVSVAKTLAMNQGIPGASSIPNNAQLMMGFTSTQTDALGPLNIVSFETLPGVTNQWSSGYFVAGCAMHLSHLYEDLATWYASAYGKQVGRMFSPHTAVSSACPVTLSNGPGDVSSESQLLADAQMGVVGHNETLQQATRLKSAVVDNYGQSHPIGTAVPIREDFNTIDNPFAWTRYPTVDAPLPPTSPLVSPPDASGRQYAAGLHFVAFVPTSSKFHAARNAMDGLLPDGTSLSSSTYGIAPAACGINSVLTTTHRQNFLVPPRGHRSFPLAELL